MQNNKTKRTQKKKQENKNKKKQGRQNTGRGEKMRLSWVIAGALLALTWLLASMQLDFLAVASFTLLIVTAMAGYYEREALSYAGGPLQAHPPKEQPPTYSPHGHSQAAAPDPNHVEGGTQPATSSNNSLHAKPGHAHESPKQKHFHEAQAGENQHSEKKLSEDAHHSHQTKQAGHEKARSHEEHGGEEQLE